MRKWTRSICVLMPLTLLTLFVGSTPLAADQERGKFKARLSGFQEVPSISTLAHGEFEAKIEDSTIEFELTFSGLEGGNPTASHIHLGQRAVNGGVVAFLCGGGGKPACPASASGTVTGTIVAADVQALPAQGIAAGEIDEVLRAMRAGVTYVNIHNATYPGGEIRGQVGRGEGRRRGRD